MITILCLLINALFFSCTYFATGPQLREIAARQAKSRPDNHRPESDSKSDVEYSAGVKPSRLHTHTDKGDRRVAVPVFSYRVAFSLCVGLLGMTTVFATCCCVDAD